MAKKKQDELTGEEILTAVRGFMHRGTRAQEAVNAEIERVEARGSAREQNAETLAAESAAKDPARCDRLRRVERLELQALEMTVALEQRDLAKVKREFESIRAQDLSVLSGQEREMLNATLEIVGEMLIAPPANEEREPWNCAHRAQSVFTLSRVPRAEWCMECGAVRYQQADSELSGWMRPNVVLLAEGAARARGNKS